jgi:hypothetical protein
MGGLKWPFSKGIRRRVVKMHQLPNPSQVFERKRVYDQMASNLPARRYLTNSAKPKGAKGGEKSNGRRQLGG